MGPFHGRAGALPGAWITQLMLGKCPAMPLARQSSTAARSSGCPILQMETAIGHWMVPFVIASMHFHAADRPLAQR